MANKKETSPKVASTASRIMTDKRYSDAARTAAASALAQAGKRKR
ncbi:hypothetical protein [Curtobacterium flaccumfaciens]|nr:hypothetical protein [Curtobacterium flaccumfaciens]MCS5465999.1 hypothetical protein [Curtobacterium flaccumfaciens pv. betae]MCX2873075.1 hypothetical protein [Curtobacterium flaccumfaciens pv. betae]UWD85601.1 hypothetical protein NY059_14905 [Curtobacterium flaccumfaciens pv. betae]UWT75089.1 hypothetical protein N3C65_04390 [Curtobacterium flaccumfaciens pv. betae]